MFTNAILPETFMGVQMLLFDNSVNNLFSVEFPIKLLYQVIDFHFFHLPFKTICWKYMINILLHDCISG